uniref:uncharacterized protein LOC105350014 n=1 Tax=Fragaria vesca subsp. vesca TaxID=101020 RepID=UPI0005C94B90|nr:PREDICTED: uncharacterized protein LOC105350014 [Fragaria vesca subsp. vesca]
MDDLLDFEPTGPVRVAGRFRPKAKSRSTKVTSTAAASNVVTESSIPVSSTVSDTIPSATSIDVGEVKVTSLVGSSSEILGSLELSGNEHLCSRVQSFDGDRTTKVSESAAPHSLQPSLMVAAFNGSHLAGKNADIFSGLECLDDFLTQTTSGTVPASRKSPDKFNGQKCDAPTHCSVESSALACDVAQTQTISDYCATKGPLSCTEASMSNEHGEIRLETQEFETVDAVSDAPISTGCRTGKFPPKLSVKKGKENPNIPHSGVEQSTVSPAAKFKTGEMDERSVFVNSSGDVAYHISLTFGDSIAPNPTPYFQENAESLTKLGDAVFGDATLSKGVCGKGHRSGNEKAYTVSSPPQKRKVSAADEEAKDGTSSRKSRKQLPRRHVEELGNNTYEDSFDAENCSDCDVDKSLVEIPEDEIDLQKVPIKDIIRLNEYRIKEAAKLKTPASNKSANDECHKEACHNEVGDRDRVSTSSPSLNYHSFMNKERPIKWSKQDTEIFYEAIKPFGFDSSIIALLFPGRTPRQIKLKLNKEKRRNPKRTDEACHCDSKDYSKYDLVINVARERQELDADESSDIADQEEVELTHDHNEGMTKPEFDEIHDMETDIAAEVQHKEAAVAEGHSPIISDQNDDVDGFGGWDDDM